MLIITELCKKYKILYDSHKQSTKNRFYIEIYRAKIMICIVRHKANLKNITTLHL